MVVSVAANFKNFDSFALIENSENTAPGFITR